MGPHSTIEDHYHNTKINRHHHQGAHKEVTTNHPEVHPPNRYESTEEETQQGNQYNITTSYGEPILHTKTTKTKVQGSTTGPIPDQYAQQIYTSSRVPTGRKQSHAFFREKVGCTHQKLHKSRKKGSRGRRKLQPKKERWEAEAEENYNRKRREQ